MPNKKRTYTEEQKQAMRDRLAKARAKKAEMKASEPTQTEEPRVAAAPVQEPEVVTETVKNGGESTDEILKRALEAIETLAKIQAAGLGTAPQGGLGFNNGRITGTVTKFSVDPNDYPSPVERLKAEERLAPFAFPLNYDITYEVSTTAYESKEGINYVEPKFNLELHRIVRNDLTGEDTGRRYVLCRLAMHEDPQAALAVARQNNLDVSELDEKALLDEMRYIQMRDWVFESFFQPISTNRNKQSEMVVGGKVVEFFEINDQNSQKLPFNELNRFRI